MTLAGDGGTCFDRAKALAADLVRSSTAGDGFSVVLLAAPVQAIVPGPADDAGKVAKEIEALRCPHGSAEPGAALSMVEELIRKAPGKMRNARSTSLPISSGRRGCRLRRPAGPGLNRGDDSRRNAACCA